MSISGKSKKVALSAFLLLVLIVVVVIFSSKKSDDSELKTPILKPVPQKTMPTPKPAEEIATAKRLMTEKEAFANQKFPLGMVSQMELVEVPYIDFDGEAQTGQIVVHQSLAKEIVKIFEEIADSKFPIDKIVPISAYDWDDDTSIDDNNTSAFNYRMRLGPGVKKKLSYHSFGVALDINPIQNPFLDKEGNGPTPYDPEAKGTVSHQSAPFKIFTNYGWTWGGDWPNGKDYQHFEKKSAMSEVKQ